MGAVLEKAERLELILQKLEMSGVVSVSDLSRELGTSVVTIRKDLRVLEKEKGVSRVPGGAVFLAEEREKDTLQYGVKIKNLELKHAVAKRAAKLIESKDSLVVTAGMTPHLTLHYAQEHSNNLKVVTESLMLAEELCRRPDYQVIILGGKIDKKDFFVHGYDAVQQVNCYMANKAIVTMDGVDPDAGLTTLRNEGVDVLRSILQRARMRILVADSTKIGLESHCRVGDISYVDVLVTNWTPDPAKHKILKKISDAGIQIFYADEVNEKKVGED